jgi:arsenate reductase-like glutaredoxin family protein
VEVLYAAKGKRAVRLDLKKERSAKADLLALLLGPSGNLRAPAIRKGRTLIVGFEEGMYKEVFG